MKKRYMEPQMIVEDFTVSEMVAKNCGLIIGELKITTQLSGTNGPCDGWLEDPEQQALYPLFSDLFEQDQNPNSDDSDVKNGIDGDDVFFNQYILDTYKGPTTNVICTIKTDALFNKDFQGFSCSSDSTLIQNSQ